jgi:DNA-binding CsgD family transcriptional regulator
VYYYIIQYFVTQNLTNTRAVCHSVQKIFFQKAISFTSCILLFFITISARQHDSYLIRNFTKKEYRAESQNWSITRDQYGYIYVANNIGLLEFDGVEWTFYPAPNGTVIRSVAVDGHNRIFTSGYREIGFWERDRTGKLAYKSLNRIAEPLFSQNEEFWNTVIIGNRVYFHSFSSLFIYDFEKFRVVRTGASINSISNINGKLCVHLSMKGLYLLEDTVLKPFLAYPALKNDIVYFCTPLKDSSLLIGTSSEGLFLYRNNKLIPFLKQWKDFFSENKINRGAVSENGNIIIGTLLEGIIIFDSNGNLLHHINNNTGLQNNTILGIHCDPDNNIWVSMDQGVDFISFLVDPSYNLYSHEEVGAIYSAAFYKGDLYLCSNQGVFYRNAKNENQEFLIIPGTQGQAWSCNVYNNQLIVSHNNGTFLIDNHTAEKISDVTGGFSIIKNPLKNNILVQSTYSTIVFYEYRDGKWQYKYNLPGFSDLIRYIELDHLNNLWASHMHRAIYRLKLNDRQDSIIQIQYSGNSIFGKDYDIQVFKIENRIIFTTGQKVYTFDDLNDSIIPYENLNHELGRYAESHRVVPGPDHHYWFIGKTGVALFEIFNSSVKKIKEYPADLFREHFISGYENIFPLAKKEGLLCLDNGYAILRAGEPDLSRLIENKRLILNKIEISGRSGKSETLPLNSKIIKIPFNKNSLTLGFAFPLWSNEPVKFQSFIEDLEKKWSEPLDKPVFSFARIPAGDYIIHVRAFNEWKKESINEKIILHVSPPWYLEPASFIIYGIVMLLMVFIARHIIIRRIRSREKKIRESKEKELISLRNEKLDAELAFKSQELATSTMSILKKNEFLLELKKIIIRQREKLDDSLPDKYFSTLTRKIDDNISSMDDWNVFEIHFERAHEKFLHKMMSRYPQLTHSDLRLCAYLRMNLSSKEIAPLLRISYRGVENHRYKLRKKLDLKTEENLTDFILSI